MERPLTYYGNPVLREKGTAVETFDSDLKSLVSDMIETMYAEEGIGLAAQQIGIAQQICVVDVRPPKESEIHFNYSYDGKSHPSDLFMPLLSLTQNRNHQFHRKPLPRRLSFFP